MSRRIAAAAAAVLSGAMLALSALPADATTGTMAGKLRTFTIPGVYGISSWGNYQRTGSRVRITVCLKDTARGVFGGAAAGVAYDGPRHQAVTTVVIGFGHTACRTITSTFTRHLVVDAVSGWQNGTVRQAGPVKQVY